MKKQETITFKVDEALARAMQGIPNRSEFIRKALLGALDNVCPLCRGTGLLSCDQQRHWARFSRSHELEQCDTCRAWHLVCAAGRGDDDNEARPG